MAQVNTKQGDSKASDSQKTSALLEGANIITLRTLRRAMSRFLMTPEKHGVDYLMYLDIRLAIPDRDVTISPVRKDRIASDMLVTDSKAIPLREYMRNPGDVKLAFDLRIHRPVELNYGTAGILANANKLVIATESTYIVYTDNVVVDCTPDSPMPEKPLLYRLQRHVSGLGKVQQWARDDMDVTDLRSVTQKFNTNES